MTQPQSFTVLSQVPPTALEGALASDQELKAAFYRWQQGTTTRHPQPAPQQTQPQEQ
jgi:hypothetical protein